MAVLPASGGPTNNTEFPLELDFAFVNNVNAREKTTAAAIERRVRFLVERFPMNGIISGVAETTEVLLSMAAGVPKQGGAHCSRVLRQTLL